MTAGKNSTAHEKQRQRTRTKQLPSNNMSPNNLQATNIHNSRINSRLPRSKWSLPERTKGNRRKSRGTKDQLLIDKLIMQNCKRRKSNLHVAWIDYKKAFDSLPHSWI